MWTVVAGLFLVVPGWASFVTRKIHPIVEVPGVVVVRWESLVWVGARACVWCVSTVCEWVIRWTMEYVGSNLVFVQMECGWLFGQCGGRWLNEEGVARLRC